MMGGWSEAGWVRIYANMMAEMEDTKKKKEKQRI